MKKNLLVILMIAFVVFNLFADRVLAAELTNDDRTIPLNEGGEEVVLTIKEYLRGRQAFNNVCSQCHLGGITKTNPDVSLSPNALALAYPSRDNIEGLMDYMVNPTTYDGFTEIFEVHPSIKSADIYPEMRNLTEDDLYSIAGYILVQPKVLGSRWGGDKTFR